MTKSLEEMDAVEKLALLEHQMGMHEFGNFSGSDVSYS